MVLRFMYVWAAVVSLALANRPFAKIVHIGNGSRLRQVRGGGNHDSFVQILVAPGSRPIDTAWSVLGRAAARGVGKFWPVRSLQEACRRRIGACHPPGPHRPCRQRSLRRTQQPAHDLCKRLRSWVEAGAPPAGLAESRSQDQGQVCVLAWTQGENLVHREVDGGPARCGLMSKAVAFPSQEPGNAMD